MSSSSAVWIVREILREQRAIVGAAAADDEAALELRAELVAPYFATVELVVAMAPLAGLALRLDLALALRAYRELHARALARALRLRASRPVVVAPASRRTS